MRVSARVAIAATAFLCALGATPALADATSTVAAIVTSTATITPEAKPIPMVGALAAGGQATGSDTSFKSLFVSFTPARAATQPSVPPLLAAPGKPVPMLAPLPPKVQSSASVAADTPASKSGTLAALVNDWLASDTTNDEHECLAVSIYFESQGQPYKGQLAVAQTILNRTRSGIFPSTVCGVVKQRGQFGFVRGGHFPSVRRAARQWQEAVAIAQIALKQGFAEVANRALYFNAGRMPSPGLVRVARFGAHIFYR